MYIEELNIPGYGRLSNVRLEPSRGLNVIYGPAGAGKTTVCNCLRDLLLGPGRWESSDGGPRCPYARPWGGHRFQARLRYTVGPNGYTLLRDFEEMSARARDDNAGREVPMADARAAAPGLVTFHLDEQAPLEAPGEGAGLARRLEAARSRVEAGERDLQAWEWRLGRASLGELEARLRKAAEVRREADALRAQLAPYEGYAQVAREHRDAVIRASARLHTLEREIADAQKMLEGAAAGRREAGARLAAYERFYTVSDADLEMIKTLDLAEGPSDLQVEEKEKNLEGFRQKEADIKKRLDEIGTRFQATDTDDDFDMRLNEHERELGRSELLTSRIVERDRLQAQIDPTRASAQRFLISGIVTVLVGCGLVGLWFKMSQAGLLWVGLLLAGVGVGMFVRKSSLDSQLRDFDSESSRVHAEIDKLKVSIDASREQVRVMLEAAGVQTIKDLRALHRELRSLQRDAETVRAYRKVLESDVEAARQKSGGRRVETPPLLVECGVLKAGEQPTPRAVADFFDAFHKFKALQQEEDGLKKRMAELQGSVGDKTAERERLREAHAAALAAMGLQTESEMEAAVTGKREYDRLKAQLDVALDRVRSVMRGADVAEVEGQLETTRSRLAELEKARPDLSEAEVSVDRLDEYRARIQQLQDVVAAARREVSALESGDEAVVAAPATETPDGGVHPHRLERQVSEAWQRVTGRALNVRASDAQGRLQFEVREGEQGPWLPVATLGSVSARLLAVLVEGESARLAGPGALPAFLDNPFALLGAAWEERLLAWLLDLSEQVQTFVTLSTPDVRDRLRAALVARGVAVAEVREDDLEILTTAAPVATPN